MTGILLANGDVHNPKVIGTISKAEVEEQSAEDKATQLPVPVGYRILCSTIETEKAYDSGILKSDQAIRFDELLSTVLFVVSIGPDCYKDTAKFPTGPWCKPGDFILVRPNSGTRVVIHGKEMRLINDDVVEAVVEDPRGVRRPR